MKYHSRYPWRRWMDGNRHDIEQGTDFDVPVIDMVAYMHRLARQNKLHVMTKTGPEVPDGVIRFIFVKALWWE